MVVCGLCLPFVALTFWAVLDAAGKEFGGVEKKAVWILVAALPFLGVVIYLFFGRKRAASLPGQAGNKKNI